MPLVNNPTLTPKQLAANQANAQLSRGPVTAEGLIRLRDSNLKHGAYCLVAEVCEITRGGLKGRGFRPASEGSKREARRAQERSDEHRK